MRHPLGPGLGSAACALALVAAACGPARQPAAAPATPAAEYMASSAPAFAFASGVLAAASVPAGRTAALCGSQLTACPGADLGQPTAPGVRAAKVGAFTEIDLAAFFDSPQGAEGAVAAGGPPPRYSATGWSSPGINGTPYPEQFFPSAGNFTVQIHGLPVTFLIPPEGVGVRSTFDLAARTDIPAPAGQYQAVWILGHGIGGGAGEVVLQAIYTSGPPADLGFDLTGWCHPAALAPGEFAAVIDPYLLAASGGKMEPADTGCGGLYAVAVPLDATRTLSALDILGSTSSLLSGVPGGAPNDFVVAVSLQGHGGP